VKNWPKKLKHRGRVLARIYRKAGERGSYRLYWRVRQGDKACSRMRDFRTYSEAKREGDKLAADLAKGSLVTALTAGQANDALAALERLQTFYQSTGRRVSLLAGISEYCEAAGKLGGYTVGEAVERFLAAWLRPYHNATGPVWGKSPDALEEALAGLRGALTIPARRNGLRHAFVTFHMAIHANENLTAAEAGNSQQMIHDHYRALATRRESVKWFAVKPSKAANVIPLPAVSRQDAH
jgi:hypothetical protein